MLKPAQHFLAARDFIRFEISNRNCGMFDAVNDHKPN